MKAIQIDDFCKFKFLSNLNISPDGKTAVFCVSEADKENNSYKSCLYTLRGNRSRKLTSFGKEKDFVFIDRDTILFPSCRDEKPDPMKNCWYKISLKGGEAEKAYTFPVSVSRMLPLKDGNFIALGSVMPGWEDLYKGDPKRAEEYKKHQEAEKDYEVIEQVPWWWNGSTYTKGEYTGLFFVDGRSGKLTWLSDKNMSVSDAELSRDGETVYYIQRPVEPFLSFNGTAELHSRRVKDGECRKLMDSKGELELLGFLPADSFVLVIASDRKHGLNTDGDFYKLDPESGELTLYAKYGEAIGSSVGSDIRLGGGHSIRMQGDVCYFISTLFDGAYLCKLEDGVISKVLEKEGSVDFFDVSGNKLLLGALFDMKGQEIYDGRGRQLTAMNSAVLKGRYVARPETLNFMKDDHEVHGFVLKPMDYEPGKKYPVIIDIHGGPKTVYGPVFYHEMQYWAGKGYFVIFCNPTGSDGRNAFMDICGKYGTVDYEDIMAFCDEALKAYPDMDAGNFFETGGSYGGFMTNWIIGHTKRFRACASQRSISNWSSFYGVSDIGVEFAKDQCRADPWNDPELLWEQSPLKYADRAVTPTLFIHSFEDYRCPIDQGYQMFTALVARGVESRMVCFRGENHELSRSGKPQHRLRRLQEITDWFDSHKA